MFTYSIVILTFINSLVSVQERLNDKRGFDVTLDIEGIHVEKNVSHGKCVVEIDKRIFDHKKNHFFMSN
jgi:hypothetical protein